MDKKKSMANLGKNFAPNIYQGTEKNVIKNECSSDYKRNLKKE